MQIKGMKEYPEKYKLNYLRIKQGLIIMLWGYFLKMVIADRSAVIVNNVFDSFQGLGSVELIIGSVSFALQIYCDFSAYSYIAIGSAQILGYCLMENFNAPYFATSIKDFWRRWHISLSTWLKDYVYISLGGNRCSNKRKYTNLMVTFLVSGIWHGANWTYIIWGALHGTYQIIGEIIAPIRERFNKKFNIKTGSFSYKLLSIIITFILVDFAWIFFRADNLNDACIYIQNLFTRFNPWILFDGTVYSYIGVAEKEVRILINCSLLLFGVDLIRSIKNQRIDEFLEEQCTWFEWLFIILLIVVIAIYGQYGPEITPAQFVYFQF